VGVRRGAASPASAAGVNGGGGEVGEEDEMREEAWKAGREAKTRLFYAVAAWRSSWRPLGFRGFFTGVAPLGWNECGGRICPYRHAAKFWEEKPKRR